MPRAAGRHRAADCGEGGSPALTRDGRTLAYVAQSDVFLRAPSGGATRRGVISNSPLLLRFRPDGRRFAAAELSALGPTQVCSYNSDLSGANEGRYCLATGISSGLDYLPNGRLIMARRGGSATGRRTVISLLRPEDGGPTGVERDLVSDPGFGLASPTVSPDGRQVAVVQTDPAGGTTSDIAIYDLTTGALVKQLTSGGGAAAPSFSSDGGKVAFDRNGGIWVIGAGGAFGSERLVVKRGRTVTWGGGSVPRAFTSLRIAKQQSGDRVRGRLSR